MAFQPSPVLLQKSEVFNLEIGPGSGILPANVTPTRNPSTFRATVALSGADATIGLTMTVGGIKHTALLNNGIELSAGVLYTFSFSASQSGLYNFELGTGGLGVHQLILEEPTGSLI